MVPRLDQCGARKPTCMDTQVNMKKVNRECIAGWISSHPELVALGDDVIIGMIINMLDAEVRGCKLVCLRDTATRYSLAGLNYAATGPIQDATRAHRFS